MKTFSMFHVKIPAFTSNDSDESGDLDEAEYLSARISVFNAGCEITSIFSGADSNNDGVVDGEEWGVVCTGKTRTL